MREPVRIERSVAQHEAIIEALERGDHADAAQRVRENLSRRPAGPARGARDEQLPGDLPNANRSAICSLGDLPLPEGAHQ